MILRVPRIGARLLLAACLAGLPVSAAAQNDDYAKSLQKLQLLDERVQNIGWRLVSGNSQFCAETQPAIGLTLQDIMGYNQPEAARAALGLPVDFAVQTVANDSPSQLAGMTPNQAVVAVGGRSLSEMVENAKAPYLRLLWAKRAIQSALDTDGSVGLTIAGRLEAVTVSAVQVCKSDFTVRPSDDKAVADAGGVYIGGRFSGLTHPDDELAAAVAHELAHVLLRHPQWLSANGRKRRDIRATEREADRMMPWLLANAGFNPEAAVRFMRKWGPKHNGGLFRNRTHDGWDERVEFIQAELPLIRAAMTETSAADWTAHFRQKTVSKPAS